MSNYQRLIAYIYTYEGGIKGKNIGFAKLETRNIQCKITVNVKKIFVGGNPMGVYLLSNQGELRIGTLFARNGAGEFRTTVNAANVEDSGRGVEEFYGLSVHDVESAWRAYTTIWEDAVAHSAEVELADVTSENLLKKQTAKEVQELPISKEIEKELALEEKREQEEIQEEVLVEKREEEKRFKDDRSMNRGNWRREGAGVRESLMKPYGAVTAAAELSPAVRETGRLEWISNTEAAQNKGSAQTKSLQQPVTPPLKPSQPETDQPHPDQPNSAQPYSGQPNPAQPYSGRPNSAQPYAGQPNSAQPYAGQPNPAQPYSGQPNSAQPYAGQPDSAQPYAGQSNSAQPAASQQSEEQSWENAQVPEGEPGQTDIEADISRPADFIPAPREENETRTHQETWELLRKKFTKILAFDYEDGCEILTIKPQDIGLLPRENWVFGNNSFLLHGYYNYRYLILARLENPNGTPRYLLGVPGNYFSNEKYMAAMFTFPDFVLSKKQPSEDSRFGYWYADIKIGD